MDMQSLIESFGVLAIAPGIAIYLHQSFVKITQQMMQAMMAESKAVDKLDKRIEQVEQTLRQQK